MKNVVALVLWQLTTKHSYNKKSRKRCCIVDYENSQFMKFLFQIHRYSQFPQNGIEPTWFTNKKQKIINSILAHGDMFKTSDWERVFKMNDSEIDVAMLHANAIPEYYVKEIIKRAKSDDIALNALLN